MARLVVRKTTEDIEVCCFVWKSLKTWIQMYIKNVISTKPDMTCAPTIEIIKLDKVTLLHTK